MRRAVVCKCPAASLPHPRRTARGRRGYPGSSPVLCGAQRAPYGRPSLAGLGDTKVKLFSPADHHSRLPGSLPTRDSGHCWLTLVGRCPSLCLNLPICTVLIVAAVPIGVGHDGHVPRGLGPRGHVLVRVPAVSKNPVGTENTEQLTPQRPRALPEPPFSPVPQNWLTLPLKAGPFGEPHLCEDLEA